MVRHLARATRQRATRRNPGVEFPFLVYESQLRQATERLDLNRSSFSQKLREWN